MRFECVAIIVVIIIMIFAFLRAKRYAFAIAITPTLSVPVLHLIGFLVAPQIQKLADSFLQHRIHIGIDVLAAALGCLLLGVFGHYIQSKKIRTYFLLCCSIFILVLTWVLCVSLMRGA